MSAESNSGRPERPIILIGLMGSGKTTVGKALSKQTGMPLLDTDAVIEEQIGKSIADIFRDEGEAHFRALETALLRYLLNTPGASGDTPPVISTGGGVVIRPENREIIRKLGFSVWLSADVPVLLNRTARNNNRPLLNNCNREEILTRLLVQRSPMYAEAAHLTIDSGSLDVQTIVRLILEAADVFFRPLP